MARIPHLTPRDYRLVRSGSAALVRACGALPVLLGVLVLLGWAFDIPGLKSAVPNAVQMKVNTAIALVLAGVALVLHTVPERSPHAGALLRLARTLGCVVAFVGAATALQYLFDLDLGIDQALVRDEGGAFTWVKGRMSPFSALAFASIGTALAAVRSPRLRVLASVCAGVPVVIGLLSLTGYLWGASELLTDELAPPVAMHTAAALVLLGVGTWIAVYRFSRGHPSLRFLVDPIELRILGSFVGALLVLIAVGGLTYGAAADYARDAQRLAQVKVLRGQLTGLYGAVADAVFAQRTFLLTGSEHDGQQWTASLNRLARARQTLAEAALPADASTAVIAVDGAVGYLTSRLQEGMDLRSQGAKAAQAFVGSGMDFPAMSDVRGAMARLDRIERDEEARREGRLRQSRQRTLALTLLALVAASAMLGAVFAAIRREMGARAQAERALRRRSAESAAANRFLESLIQNIPHMIFVKDAANLRFVRLNRAGERLTGLSEQAIAGKTDYDFFPREQAEFFVAKDRQVLERGEVLDIPEEEIQTADSGLRLLHTKKIPLLDETGRPTHLVGISEDVTEARANERQIATLHEALRVRAEEVERVSRARATFLATMSHEIRTPMNGMMGMLELLSLSPLDERQRQAVGVISASGQSLLRIIDDILDLSKIEAGKLQLREEVASVAAIVREVQDIHSAVAGGKGLALVATIAPDLSPAMWIDPVRLRQVLNNFVSNAVKFTREGSVEIRVEVLASTSESQSLRLSVIDTGVGVSAEEQKRLFEPFVQASAGSLSAAGGTGLGLVISRRLAELMGGSVHMISSLGHGTSLNLDLQVRTAPAHLLPQPMEAKIAELRRTTQGLRAAPSVEQAQAEGTLILVVDDHPVNRMLLQEQLESVGYACETASGGQQALERLQQARFGLVLTDCQMPGMTGYELARRIRESEAATGARRLPIIACTAMALEGEAEKCRQAGMDDVMFKPVELRPLLEKLTHWLPIEGRDAPLRAVDTAMISSTWGCDAATMRHIVGVYHRTAGEDCAALRDAVGRRDVDTIREVAHRMLGASKTVGARGLAEGSERLRVAAREGDWEAIAAAMAHIETQYAELTAELQAGG